MNSIKVCEYSRSRSFHDDLILQDQASGERSQDQWSSGSFGDHVGLVVNVNATGLVPGFILEQLIPGSNGRLLWS